MVQRLPTAVVAGIVVMLAWTLVDRWTRALVQQWLRGERSMDLALSLLIVVVVCAVTLRWGFVVGVAAGVVVAMLIFVRALNRSLLRLRYRASEIPSRRITRRRWRSHCARYAAASRCWSWKGRCSSALRNV